MITNFKIFLNEKKKKIKKHKAPIKDMTETMPELYDTMDSSTKKEWDENFDYWNPQGAFNNIPK